MLETARDGAILMNVARNEAKYQMLKLVRSGRSLREAKALMKVGTVALTTEYAKAGDLKDLQNLEAGLHRIRKTRNDAKQIMKLKFAPRTMESSREEVLAKFGTGYKGKIPLDWKRDGNLIRRGRPNKPRPGSSKGKIGRARVIGAKKVLQDFEALTGTLQALIRKHGKGDTQTLQKAFKAIRTGVIVRS
jgi:hypothetical protein